MPDVSFSAVARRLHRVRSTHKTSGLREALEQRDAASARRETGPGGDGFGPGQGQGLEGQTSGNHEGDTEGTDGGEI